MATRTQGMIITYVLVFGAIFLILLSGLLNFILFQQNQSLQNAAREDSLHIAEAGINYYKWNLNKAEEITEQYVQDGQDWCCDSKPYSSGECEWCGPYIHNFRNSDGNIIGEFEISIRPKKMCGKILAVWVKSKGHTLEFPEVERTIQVKLAATSIADYAYILNENVCAGGDRNIYGKYMSNWGIKMDATHNSLVMSARGTSTEAEGWVCNSSFGCDYDNCPDGCIAYDLDEDGNDDSCLCQGVIGGGSPKDLWKLKVPKFNFDEIQSSLVEMKSLATSTGKYYPPSDSLDPSGKGYWVIFNSDGTFEIRVVTRTISIDAATLIVEEGKNKVYCYESEEKIRNWYSLGVTTTPSGCGLIFVEDNLWVQGTVKGLKTIAAAKLGEGERARVILNNNIDYAVYPPDGSDSLSIITQGDILIPLESPYNMDLKGVFVTQYGHFGRELYSAGHWWWCDNLGGWRWRGAYPADAQKNNLTIYGSIVSSGRVGTKWGYWYGWGGYNQRENYFDEKLSRDPPPLLPCLSKELNFISWEEIQ